MFIGTHTLLPVALALAGENTRLALGRDLAYPAGALPAIGLFGALPDLCSPHLSLEARYSSGSHTLLFLGLVLPVCIGVACLFPRGSRRLLALSCWIATVLHLAADALSGGIAWLRPWSDSILGAYAIHPDLWPVSDGLFVLLTWLLLSLRRRLRLKLADTAPAGA